MRCCNLLLLLSIVLVGCVNHGRDRVVLIDTTDTLTFPMAESRRASAQAMLAQLKGAITRKDSEAVAALISYPLTLNGAPAVLNSAQFIARFSSIVNSKVRSAMLARPSDQLVESVEGIAIGGGAVWIQEACPSNNPKSSCSEEEKRFRVVAINNMDEHP